MTGSILNHCQEKDTIRPELSSTGKPVKLQLERSERKVSYVLRRWGDSSDVTGKE